MAEEDLREWTTFFHAAGVPRGPDNDYATLFCNHRIKKNQLGDLTKEILSDIGINVMGDVMCILKHAQTVYAKLEREKLSNQLIQADPEPVVATKPDPSPFEMKKKKAPTKQTVQPKTAAQETLTITSTTRKKLEPKITVTVNDFPLAPKKRPSKSSMTLSERFASKAASQPKISRLSAEGNKTQTVAARAKSPPPLKLAAADKATTNAPVKRKSAFERLDKGESSTMSKEVKQLSPRIKITKMTRSPVKAPESKVISLSKNESSVFRRLGESEASPVASSTRAGALTVRTGRGLGSRIVSDDSPEKPAKSHSVLRPLKPIRAVQPVKPVSSVKARISIEAPKESTKKSVFSRLGSPT